MFDLNREIWREMCDREGISWAKGHVITFEMHAQGYVREWIDEQERKESVVREEANRLISEKAVAAAQLSAETSAAAAEASKKSARWTMIAAIAAAASATLPLLQALGLLPR